MSSKPDENALVMKEINRFLEIAQSLSLQFFMNISYFNQTLSINNIFILLYIWNSTVIGLILIDTRNNLPYYKLTDIPNRYINDQGQQENQKEGNPQSKTRTNIYIKKKLSLVIHSLNDVPLFSQFFFCFLFKI